MENKYSVQNLELITEGEFLKAKQEAIYSSDRVQNYHCMLSGWLREYQFSAMNSLKDQTNFCEDIICRVFDQMETEPNISKKTVNIYKLVCQSLIKAIDNKPEDSAEVRVISQKYIPGLILK